MKVDIQISIDGKMAIGCVEVGTFPKMNTISCEFTEKVSSMLKRLQPKPPIGIIPQHVHDMARLDELVEAIDRYKKACINVPQDWSNELCVLMDRYKYTEKVAGMVYS